jgi:membrane fusion protein, multidrug efflux system
MSEILLKPTIIPSPQTRDLRRQARKLAPAILALMVAAGAATYGVQWWRVGRFIETTDDAYAGGNVTPVAPHVAGFVGQILVSDNQHVDAGQLLIKIDDRDFAAALNHAKAVADERQAMLAGLQAKLVLQQATIHEAEANLAAKTASASFAKQDAIRYTTLAQTPAGSRQDAERAQANGEAARATTEAATAALAAARQQLAVLDAQIAEARAGVAQAEADLETAHLNLGYTEIRAPIEGYIGNRAAQVGAYITSGTYLLSVIPARGLAAGAAGDGGRRRASRQNLSRACRKPSARHGLGVQRDPSGECHRQLHQDRATRPGPHRARRWRRAAWRVTAGPVDYGQHRHAPRRPSRGVAS